MQNFIIVSNKIEEIPSVKDLHIIAKKGSMIPVELLGRQVNVHLFDDLSVLPIVFLIKDICDNANDRTAMIITTDTAFRNIFANQKIVSNNKTYIFSTEVKTQERKKRAQKKDDGALPDTKKTDTEPKTRKKSRKKIEASSKEAFLQKIGVPEEYIGDVAKAITESSDVAIGFPTHLKMIQAVKPEFNASETEKLVAPYYNEIKRLFPRIIIN